MECRGIKAEHAPRLLPAHLHAFPPAPHIPISSHAPHPLACFPLAPHIHHLHLQASHIFPSCQDAYRFQKALEAWQHCDFPHAHQLSKTILTTHRLPTGFPCQTLTYAICILTLSHVFQCLSPSWVPICFLTLLHTQVTQDTSRVSQVHTSFSEVATKGNFCAFSFHCFLHCSPDCVYTVLAWLSGMLL